MRGSALNVVSAFQYVNSHAVCFDTARKMQLFVLLHKSGPTLLLPLANSMWSCIPSGVSYVTPLEPLQCNLQLYTLYWPLPCLLYHSLHLHSITKPWEPLVSAFVPTGVSNECGNLSQLKWSISPWGRLRF